MAASNLIDALHHATKDLLSAKGLVAEGKSAIEEKGEGRVKDLLLTGAGRKVERVPMPA